MSKKIIFIVLIYCSCLPCFSQVKTAITSNNIIIGKSDTISSAVLAEKRIVNIYLPENYSPDSATRYPVIYLLDGGIDEDFIHIAGLVRYNSTSWIGRVPTSIVVGIENVNRRRDFTYATPNLAFVTKMGFDEKMFMAHGGSGKFIAFIENELQPFIQTNYKTTLSKTIIGESLGGLLATEILLRKPGLFDTYIIVSPSLWWGAESLLKETAALKRNPAGQLKVYIGAAKKEEDLVMFNDAQSLFSKLKDLKDPQLQLHFDYLPAETHATILHQAVYNAFRQLYPVSK